MHLVIHRTISHAFRRRGGFRDCPLPGWRLGKTSDNNHMTITNKRKDQTMEGQDQEKFVTVSVSGPVDAVVEAIARICGGAVYPIFPVSPAGGLERQATPEGVEG